MTNDETEISFEQPGSMIGTWLGIVLLFAVFALFVWAVMGAMPHGDEYEQKRATARTEKLKTAREEASTALHGYSWVDKSKGVARVPIQRAMELSVSELAQKKPTMANPIPPEPAAGGPQTTAPGAPTAAASAPPSTTSSPKATSIAGEKSEARGQPTGAANPPGAAAGTQPGPSTTPAASPPPPSSQAQPNPSAPTRTPVPAPAGTPIPLPGATP